VTVPVNGAVTLRLVAAFGSASQMSVDITGPCTMHVVAFDGVYLRAVQTKTKINMLAGSRVDVQIYCTGAGTSELKLAGQAALYVVASSSGGRGFHSSTSQLNLCRSHH
jgi:hypothetical protein